MIYHPPHDPGDLRPDRVVRRPGFVSGTVGNECRCLEGDASGDGEVCPTRRRGGYARPWRGYGRRGVARPR